MWPRTARGWLNFLLMVIFAANAAWYSYRAVVGVDRLPSTVFALLFIASTAHYLHRARQTYVARRADDTAVRVQDSQD